MCTKEEILNGYIKRTITAILQVEIYMYLNFKFKIRYSISLFKYGNNDITHVAS